MSSFFGADFATALEPTQRKTVTQRQGGYLAYLRKHAPAGYSYDAAHIKAKAALVDRLVSGELDRVRIHEPPRHAKTSTVTINLPVYIFERNPKARVLVTCHTATFARRLGRRIRNLAIKRGVKVSKDKKAAGEWATDEGGLFIATGVGSPPTGEGFDWIIIDDPIKKREQADSLTFRDKLDDWYTEEIYTRLEPGGKVIGIWTLWHEDDLAGRLDARSDDDDEDQQVDTWTVLKLPAIAGDDDPLGREPGEALWPERIPLKTLVRIRANMLRRTGRRGWEALYQQNPSPLDGDVFKPGMLKSLPRRPLGLTWVRAWDVAASDGKGDWTVGALMAETPELDVVVGDVVRVQLDTGERDKFIVETAKADGEDVTVVLPLDPAAAGKSQVVYWSRMLSGYRFVFVRPKGDKVTRAQAFSAQVNMGNAALVRGSWNAAFREELRQFPNGANDDQVDASGDGHRVLVGGQKRAAEVY